MFQVRGLGQNTFLLNSFLTCLSHVWLFQGEEGPPSLEYIQAKDLFPHKELIKEEESLQVSGWHQA